MPVPYYENKDKNVFRSRVTGEMSEVMRGQSMKRERDRILKKHRQTDFFSNFNT